MSGFRRIYGPAVTQGKVVGRDIVWSKNILLQFCSKRITSLMSVGSGWYQTGGSATGRRIKPDDE